MRSHDFFHDVRAPTRPVRDDELAVLDLERMGQRMKEIENLAKQVEGAVR